MLFSKRYSMLLPLWLLTCNVYAVSCLVSTNTVSFGSYDVFSPSNTDSTGSVTVTCDPVTTAFTIALESGLYGPVRNRAMQSTTSNTRLRYNLYLDAAHSTIWGNGTGNTLVVNGNAPGSFTVYGRIPPGQNVEVGSYSDSVTVTVTF